MIEPFLWILWGIWMLQSGFLAANAVLWFPARRRQDRRFGDVPASARKPVALIVAIKGFDEKLTPAFFEAIFTQDYPDYRVILSVEEDTEPVVDWLRQELEMDPMQTNWSPDNPSRGLRHIRIVFAGRSEGRGQKVHNQLRAIGELEARDELIAFADVDIRCGRDWLSRLTAPLNLGYHQFSSGYRWLIPLRYSVVNLFASVINSSVATVSGRNDWTMMWGGSMAMTRKAFRDIGAPDLLESSLNDDLRISKAARQRGYRIASIRSLMVPSPIDFTWKSLVEFGARQYYQVRHFTPVLFGLALCSTWLYVLGFGTAVAAVVMGEFHAWIPIGAVTLCDQVRALSRARIIQEVLDESSARLLNDTGWIEHLLTPVWMAIHCLMVSAAALAREITWSGVTYRVGEGRTTEIVRREGPAGGEEDQETGDEETNAGPAPPEKDPGEESREEVAEASESPDPADETREEERAENGKKGKKKKRKKKKKKKRSKPAAEEGEET